MHFRIYQPDLTSAGKPERYLLVHEDEVAVENIYELCSIFSEGSSDHRRGKFRGCSLQQGDIIEVLSEQESNFYVCKSGEWLDIHPSLLQNDQIPELDHQPASNTITGVLAEPDERARTMRLSLDAKTMERYFGLNYCVVALPTGDRIICGASAFERHYAIDQDLNRTLRYHDGEMFAAVRGPIFFCNIINSADEDVICSLSKSQCYAVMRQYELPETFYLLNEKLMSVKFYPELCNNAAGECVQK